MINIRLTVIIIFLLNFFYKIIAQTKVAITIDDVPNTRLFHQSNGRSVLLEKLDSLKIPTTIFVNESLLFKNDSIVQNIKLLENWISNENIEVGNHTYSHLRYSETQLDTFVEDFEKGTYISKPLAKKYRKKIEYFRFPYNDLGIDSSQHATIRKFLLGKQKIAPFTVESSDWMFNTLYTHYLKNNNIPEARRIGMQYIEKTLAYFDHFEALAREEYERQIPHIYLCHDNILNTEYLPVLINELSKRDYEFISMNDAMKDNVYHSKDEYYKKWGISWLYRWLDNASKRKNWFMKEPDIKEIQAEYEIIK